MSAVSHVRVHVVSDSLGDTACEVVLAAAAQFECGVCEISRLSKVSTLCEVERYLADRRAPDERTAVFYTIVNLELREQVAELLARESIPSVDLMGPSIDVLSSVFATKPLGVAGAIHKTDERYFARIEAMEYAVEHDDGRAADDLDSADIVLIGVSRTSKTPLSMYLASLGYRVANIPLVSGVEPPRSLFEIDAIKVIGLVCRVETMASIRDRRLGDALSRAVASSYADPLAIASEIDEARALMKRLGCFVVRTDGKPIEESAAEIIAHFESVARM